MAFARNGPVRLYWRLDGAADRPVLMLLNSIGTDLALWDRLVPLLTPWFRLLRMDARGHGASDAPAGDYRLEDLSADALAVMDAAGVSTAAVCGVSLGGMVAMTMALDAPGRIEALALVCTSAAMDRRLWTARIEAVRAGGMAAVADTAMERFVSPAFRRGQPEAVESLRHALLAQDAAGYIGCCAAIRDMDLSARIGALSAPTLVIGGARDVATPFEAHGQPIAEAIPGASTRLVEAAHLPPLENPAALATALVGFLVGEAQDAYAAGLATRRRVLGEAWVDRSLAGRTALNTEFQARITRNVWHEVWNRPGLDRRTRRLLVLAITAAQGRWEEFRLHVRAGLEQSGFTPDELEEVLLQLAAYAGVPAANTAFAEAGAILADLS